MDQLLSRCFHGGTQNQNEAINALIWQRATKEAHSGLVVVEFTAVFLAANHFNDGAKALIFSLEELDIDPGCHWIATCQKLEYNRV